MIPPVRAREKPLRFVAKADAELFVDALFSSILRTGAYFEF
jgi:hypothetical protein